MLQAEKALFNKQLLQVESSSFKNKIIRYFPDTFLGNGHRGLRAISKKNGIDISKLSPGEYVIFVNKAQTGLKLFCMGNLIAYLKMPGSSRINPDVIIKIPKFFNGTEINYDKALREVVSQQFKKRLRPI